METIVVGVDGSDGSTAALEFAAEEAALREAPLRIVAAWDVPAAVYGSGFTPAVDAGTLEALGGRMQELAEEAAEKAKKLQPSIEVEAAAVAGQPADVLLETAAGAGLIVVGRRGLGGFKTLLLGSVSQQVVHHASCPVVVVNEPSS
jgi:nucleotide-binding universal stress UspA family protein